MTIPHQLSFSGREVQAVKLTIGGLDIDHDLEDHPDWSPDTGDQIEVTMRFVVVGVGNREKHDSQGIGTGPYAFRIDTKPIMPGFKISGIKTKAELDEAWSKSHGATG